MTIITPTNSDSLVKSTAQIVLKTYTDLKESYTLEDAIQHERDLLQYNFENNVEAYRKHAQRKVKYYYLKKLA